MEHHARLPDCPRETYQSYFKLPGRGGQAPYAAGIPRTEDSHENRPDPEWINSGLADILITLKVSGARVEVRIFAQSQYSRKSGLERASLLSLDEPLLRLQRAQLAPSPPVMKTLLRSLLCTVSGLGLASLHGAPPLVSNLSASQRPGTKLVDITFDVAADTPTVEVALEISSDGGANFSVPATAVSGDIGTEVTVGPGKTISWDAGVDWDQQVSSQTRFRVIADDGLPEDPPPPGFSFVRAGSFTLGDALDGMSSAPAHTVTLSSYYMEQREVTKELWDTVRSWGLNNGYTDLPAGNGTSILKGENHPVHSISWYAMVKWCNARSEQDGFTPVYYTDDSQTLVYRVGDVNVTNAQAKWDANGYRLPTEAEWEKAARGGLSGKRFPWGDTINHSNANFRANSNAYPLYDTSGYTTYTFHPDYDNGPHPYTSPVGSFPPNDYGLYDMAGNVLERCWDWYGEYDTDLTTDPRGPIGGAYRVIRGGSWFYYASSCRTAYRGYFAPDFAVSYYGFRVVRSSD